MDGFGEDLVTERSGERDLGGSEIGACFIYFDCKLVWGGPKRVYKHDLPSSVW